MYTWLSVHQMSHLRCLVPASASLCVDHCTELHVPPVLSVLLGKSKTRSRAYEPWPACQDQG